MLFDPYAADLARSARRSPLAGAALAVEEPAALPDEALAVLWQGLMEAVEGACDLWERTPPGHHSPPPLFTVQHAGKPYFNSAALREQTLAGWHRLMGLELRLAVQALEALALAESELYRALLAEQCARVGQLYDELKRRAGAFALHIFRWEVRLLRYRASPVVAPLIYD